MVYKTGIIPDGWSERLPLRQPVNKLESYFCARRVKDADEKIKTRKNKTEENLARLIKIRSCVSKAMA